jgi:serine/threonine protein kinase
LNENFIINYNELDFLEKIGEGGYGRVFHGKFSGIDVAIKEYGRKKLDHKKAEDFVKEIEVISNLRHPNIVLCMGVCIYKGKYLMIIEYLEEGSLFDHLHKNNTKINEDTLYAIIEDIALGMTYLHGRKVLHCDLKSSNILIDSSWSVKLCDFGLSRTKAKKDNKK